MKPAASVAPATLTIAQYLKNPIANAKIKDSSANLAKNIDALKTKTTNINSIALSDNKALAISSSQYKNDASVLAKVSSSYTVSLSNVAVADIIANTADGHVASMDVVDTTWNFTNWWEPLDTGVDALTPYASKIRSIDLPDGKPGDQLGTSALGYVYTGEINLFSKVTHPSVSLSALTVNEVLADLKLPGVAEVWVYDSAANIAKNIDMLNSVIAKIKIVVSDPDPIPFAITSAQYKKDSAAIANIKQYNPYSIPKFALSNVAAADVARFTSDTSVASVDVVDTAANILKNLDALSKAPLSSVKVTGKLAITKAQLFFYVNEN